MSDQGIPQRPELTVEPGRPLPIFARRDGVEVVVISLASYRELLAAQARATRETIGTAVRAAKAPPPGLSTIEKDAEVAHFLMRSVSRTDDADRVARGLRRAVREGARSVTGPHSDVPLAVEAVSMTERPSADPIRTTIAGVELVTIPVSHYAELLDCRRLVAEAGIEKWQYRGTARSRIERDPEVATLLTELMGKVLLKDAHVAVRERFGTERTPGQSTIGRFWNRLRQA